MISRRALELGAVNVGQGFPDYPIDPRLADVVQAAIVAGHNQYAPMEGVVALREQIARKLEASYGQSFDPQTEITVTCGGTEAVYDAIQAVVGAGDEAVIFDPSYDVYDPAVRLAGGRSVRIALQPPAFAYDWDEVRRALSPRTRLVIINTPHNPTCTVAGGADLDALAALIRDRPITVLSDEVYEHVLFDGRRHHSVLAHAELRPRSFAVFSFGKTLHATGWRTGYCVAPADMTRELRKIHQFNTFSIAAPLQHAIARYIADHPESWQGLSAFFGAKRALLTGLLGDSGLRPVPSAGTYFQLVDYGALSDAPDVEFADRLLHEAGVATIPLTPFYAAPPRMTLLRLCLAKRDDTLREAAARLRAFASGPAASG